MEDKIQQDWYIFRKECLRTGMALVDSDLLNFKKCFFKGALSASTAFIELYSDGIPYIHTMLAECDVRLREEV